MQKAAPLIIFEWIQFSGRTCRGSTAKRSLQKQNGRSHGKMSLLSAPGSVLIKTTLMKSLAEVLWYTQTMFLSAQMIEVLGANALLRWFRLWLLPVTLVQVLPLDEAAWTYSCLTWATCVCLCSNDALWSFTVPPLWLWWYNNPYRAKAFLSFSFEVSP